MSIKCCSRFICFKDSSSFELLIATRLRLGKEFCRSTSCSLVVALLVTQSELTKEFYSTKWLHNLPIKRLSMRKHKNEKIWRNLSSARYTSIYYSLSSEDMKLRVLKRVWGFFMAETNRNVRLPLRRQRRRRQGFHFAFYLFNPCEYNKNG